MRIEADLVEESSGGFVTDVVMHLLCANIRSDDRIVKSLGDALKAERVPRVAERKALPVYGAHRHAPAIRILNSL